MTINEIFTKYYATFYAMLPNTDKVVYDGKTYEDILGDVCMTSLKHFKNEQIDENEGFEYIKKTLLEELLFSKKRKNSRIIFLPDLPIKSE